MARDQTRHREAIWKNRIEKRVPTSFKSGIKNNWSDEKMKRIEKVEGKTYTTKELRKELISLGYEDIFNIAGYEDCIFVDGDIIVDGQAGSVQLFFETRGRNIKVTDVVLPESC